MSPRLNERGFTLAEAIIVIAITGIIAAVVTVFIRKPVEGFFDTSRRAALVDAADTALRRMGRDLREALPNSVRVHASNTAIEFLHMRSAGRYREQAPGDILDFTANDATFDVLSPGVNVQSTDWIVVYNLGITGSNAYDDMSAPTSRRGTSTTGTSVSSITLSPTTRFPFASPARRFQVVDTPVSYICSGTQLRRYTGYTIATTQPVPPGDGTSALLVDGVAAGGCSFSYAAGVSQRDALVTMTLNLTTGRETIGMVYQVHVNNAP